MLYNCFTKVAKDLEQIYLCDMGIAKVKEVAEATITSMSRGPGTITYMAPEMYQESRRGPAVDIYSLGCSFIELFGKKHVWQDLSAAAIMSKMYATPPQMPSTAHLEAPFKELCTTMTDLDPSKRPSIQEVSGTIEGIQADFE